MKQGQLPPQDPPYYRSYKVMIQYTLIVSPLWALKSCIVLCNRLENATMGT